MDKDPRPKRRRRGANRNEEAVKRRKPEGPGQSRDIREDRGVRQTKLGFRKEGTP